MQPSVICFWASWGRFWLEVVSDLFGVTRAATTSDGRASRWLLGVSRLAVQQPHSLQLLLKHVAVCPDGISQLGLVRS
jgi:hypothetical protein